MSSGVRAALGLGANLGDREATLEAAVRTIAATPEVSVVGVSPLFQTAPVGGPPQADYLNAVVVVDTTLAAEALLVLAQRCEHEAGRVRDVRWGPRSLDVDVLAYGQVESDEPLLVLPHPRATQRAFVMVPWACVDPDFVVSGRSVRSWATALDHSGVRQVEGDL